jgi:iron complex transport system ATP-binding protein
LIAERAQQEPAAALAVDSVTVGYSVEGRTLVALRDVSLSLGGGEIVGLIGPNGSGKTTLIRVATGALTPASGNVRIYGLAVSEMRPADVARQIAVVPQDPVLPAGFTAFVCVMMGRTPYLRLLQNETAADAEIARNAMLATDTWTLAGRRLGELSGGERQRVVVARALAQQTPILLLDEPTAHLDIGHQAAILRLVRSAVQGEGKAVLAVVHDLTLAAQMCDRLVLMNDGVIAASGRPEEVLTPDRIRDVYGTAVDVFPHPRTGGPVVAPSPGPP